jgi:hypothetical protein
MSTLRNTPALLFDDDHLVEADVSGAFWLADADGSIVSIYSVDGGYAGEGYMFAVYNTGGGYLSTITFAEQGAAFGAQAYEGPYAHSYIFDSDNVTNDGALHYTIMTSDSTMWEFYTDGVGPTATGSLAGTNDGDWYGQMPSPSFVSVGQLTAGDGGPLGQWQHFGHVAEVLIYDHPLTEAERAAIDAYVASKYTECVPTEDPETSCSDGIDNDCDGLVDDADPDCETGAPTFIRGDTNADGDLNITDGIFLLNYLYLGGTAPPCLDSADCNDDGEHNITDGIFILNYLYLGGTEPPPPFEACGVDPVAEPADAFDCAEFEPCP